MPALIARLADGDLEQRDALNSAFATLGEVALDDLVTALGDARPAARAHAADALGHVGSPTADAAVDALSGLLGDADADVRLAAVSALGVLDRQAAVDALTRAAASDDAVVAGVAKRLLGR